MKFLELKIPPPLFALLLAAAMWKIAEVTPLLALPAVSRIAVAAVLALFGAGLMIAGVSAFRRAKTTVNPMAPGTTTSLISTGVYGMSRNPMYVGVALVLVAWAVFLSSVFALLGPVVFVVYMNRFQIEPEEKALSEIFGAGYDVYKSRVRRWL